jgi:hypothetical protein
MYDRSALDYAITRLESGGDYKAIGPEVTYKSGRKDRAYGKRQVMGANIPGWTKKHYGRELTPSQFLADNDAQDAVFYGEMDKNFKKYGNVKDMASVWFTGRPYDQGKNSTDGYTKATDYISNFEKFYKMALNPGKPISAPGIQSANAQANAPEENGILSMLGGGIKSALQNPNLMGNLAMGFNSMRLNPDQQLNQTILAQRKQRHEATMANKSAQWLASQPGGRKFAEAVANGMPFASAYQAYLTQMHGSSGKNKTSADTTFYKGTGLTVQNYQDGTVVVKDIKGNVLEGEAAQKAIEEARRAEADMVGEAERARGSAQSLTDIFDKTIKTLQNVGSTKSNLLKALDAVNEGAFTGLWSDYLPNVTKSSAQLYEARNRLGLDIIGSVTFGALSQGEMNLAMDTALPTDLSPALLKDYILRRISATEKMEAALFESAEILSSSELSIDEARSAYVENMRSTTADIKARSTIPNMTLGDLTPLVQAIANGSSQLSGDERQQVKDRVSELARGN